MPGRCVGCGRTGSAGKIEAHTAECGEWASIYAQDPAAMLTPEQEYDRWKSSSEPQDARDARREAAMAGNAHARSAHEHRFRKPNLLED